MLVEVMKFGKEEKVIVTSLDVAETFGKEHRRVLQDIRELGCSEDFRLHNFVQSSYENAQGKDQPLYVMTRNGFALLAMGYTGDTAMRFKEAYIQQFDQMENLLRGKLVEREKGIVIRHALTDAIQKTSENARMHGHAYSVYTDMIYKTLFGETAAQMRERRELKPGDDLRGTFTAEQLEAVQTMEHLVSGLVGCGLSYDEIKAYVTQINAKRKSLVA